MSENVEQNGGGQDEKTLLFIAKQNKLHEQIKEDNVEEVENLMKTMTEPEQLAFLVPSKCAAPVLLAIEYSSMKCLRYLLDFCRTNIETFNDMEVDQVDGFVDEANQNAFHYVAMRDREAGHEAANILEEHQSILTCIVNRPDNNGISPLLTAVKRNNVAVARLLVRSGACFDILIKDQSPINIAVTNGQVEILEEMIKATEESKLPKLFTNAELFGEGHTIFYPAACSGSDKIFRILFEKMRENAETNLKIEMCHREDSFIKYISSSGMTFAMEKIMELKEKISDKKPPAKEVKSATPLMWAAKFNQLEMVKLILKNDMSGQIVNMEDERGRNVFHYAAEAKEPDVLEYLMEDKDRQLYDNKDDRDCSPLHCAAVADLPKNVEKLLLEDNIKMSNHSIFHCRFCVKEISAEMLKLILDKYEESKMIDLDHFFEIQNKKKRTPLQEAAYAGRTDILEIYIEKGALIQLRSTYLNWTVLHFAVAGKSLDTVKFLVGKSKDMVNSWSDDDETPAVIAAEGGNAKILKYLLENGAKVCRKYPKVNLLDSAIRYPPIQDRVNTALVIIKFCDNKGGINLLKELMNDSVLRADGTMSKLVKKMPIVAYEILNKCSNTIEHANLKNARNHEYYFFPLLSEAQEGRLKAIDSMVKYQRDDCLGHPVVVKFLDEKWNNSSAKSCYIVNIVLYAIFLFTMTSYICLQARGSYKTTSPVLVILSTISIVVVLLNILKEIIQIVFRWKEYFFDPNNYLEWLMYTSALVYVSPPSEEKTVGQIQAGAIAVLLAWINFIWFFKRLSFFGIYIIMAKKIFTSLLKVLPMVFLFIFAFSMAFFLLMGNDIGFDGIPIALLTTSVMMVGEVNYREVFLDNEKGPYIVLQRIILLFFLMVITIVLMNLFVGIAVGDTAETIKRSKAEKRFDKASLIVSLQHSFLHIPWITLYKTEDHLIVKPEKPRWYVKLWESIYRESELDDADEDNAMILSRLERLESSMIRLIKALEKNGNRSEVKIESDE